MITEDEVVLKAYLNFQRIRLRYIENGVDCIYKYVLSSRSEVGRYGRFLYCAATFLAPILFLSKVMYPILPCKVWGAFSFAAPFFCYLMNLQNLYIKDKADNLNSLESVDGAKSHRCEELLLWSIATCSISNTLSSIAPGFFNFLGLIYSFEVGVFFAASFVRSTSFNKDILYNDLLLDNCSTPKSKL